jgi:hypothetical protein
LRVRCPPTAFSAAHPPRTETSARPVSKSSSGEDYTISRTSETPQYWPASQTKTSVPNARVGSKPGLPPWGPHVRFHRADMSAGAVRWSSCAILQARFSRLTNGSAWNAVSAFANCGRAVAKVRGSYGPMSDHYAYAGFSGRCQSLCADVERIPHPNRDRASQRRASPKVRLVSLRLVTFHR